MKVKFIDLSRNDYIMYEDALKRVFKHGIFILGEEVEKFEKKIEEKFGSFCVGVSSGTDALIIALKAYGIKEGDEVVLPNISYIATANAVAFTGATPVFCDVEDDFQLDPKRLESLITPKTKAVIMVHYGGSIGKIEKVKEIARKHGLILIEDAAQAFGAVRNGKFAGTIGDIGCFSLNPMKVLGAFGEAGMVLTKDKNVYNRLYAMRNNGLDQDKKSVTVGFNAKMDALQAAVLKEKLKFTEINIRKRQKIVKKYNDAFENFVKTPEYSDDSVYFTYTVLTERRDELLEYLNKNGIEAKVYHTAITLERPYRAYHHKNLENSVKLSRQKIALPCNEYMSEEEVDYVIYTVKKFFSDYE